MAIMAANSEKSVIGKLSYLHPDSEPPEFHMGPPGTDTRRVGQHTPVAVEILNARLLDEPPQLEGAGFTLIQHNTSDVNFDCSESIKADYYPQVETVFKQVTGAEKIIMFDHTVRVDSNIEGVQRPARHVHNDYTAASTVQRVIDLVGGDEAVSRLRHRFIELNLWRPIEHTVESSPLALADARSIETDDLVKADIIYADRRGEVFEVVHRDTHRWYYYPNMTTDEALIIKGYDSSPHSKYRFTPHTAFDDPQSPLNPVPRKSIELRAMAFFNA